MPPGDGAAPPRQLYAILIHPDVQTALDAETAARYSDLRRAIDSLQSNPRPPGAQASDEYAPGLVRLVMGKMKPKTLFSYRVDDGERKIAILAYREWLFQG
jgi:hypothetical protein